MRTNSNKKVHKVKPDAFSLLVRAACIFAGIVVVGLGLAYLCGLAVDGDYNAILDRIAAENAQGEVEFNARMNELRRQNSAADAAVVEPGAVQGESPSWERTIGETVWRVSDESQIGLENTSIVTLDRASLLNGGLLLVNPWHSLPTDFSEQGLISVGQTSGFTIQVQDNTVMLFQPAYEALQEALAAAKEDGMEYYIVREGYRSVAAQEQLFSEEMQDLSRRYSDERLIAETKKVVNYPGTSDYHTGMTFRMDVYQRGNSELNNQKFQSESAQGEWLTENCWKYGIIFRFPSRDFPNPSWEDKSYKTGVSSQLNMYRFVGKAHSAAMKVLDMCLEEYVEFLIDHPHICIYEDGALVYEVVRIKGAGSNYTFDLPVPNPATSYQASFDNMDGVVMAYCYR